MVSAVCNICALQAKGPGFEILKYVWSFPPKLTRLWPSFRGKWLPACDWGLTCDGLASPPEGIITETRNKRRLQWPTGLAKDLASSTLSKARDRTQDLVGRSQRSHQLHWGLNPGPRGLKPVYFIIIIMIFTIYIAPFPLHLIKGALVDI